MGAAEDGNHGDDYQGPQPVARGTIFMIAGYSAHTTRYTYSEFIKRLTTSGVTVVSFDFAGFGYSEGTRCLVRESDVMLDDWQQVGGMVWCGVVQFNVQWAVVE